MNRQRSANEKKSLVNIASWCSNIFHHFIVYFVSLNLPFPSAITVSHIILISLPIGCSERNDKPNKRGSASNQCCGSASRILPFTLMRIRILASKQKAENLEKVLKRAHISYILACNLQIDTYLDPTFIFDADPSRSGSTNCDQTIPPYAHLMKKSPLNLLDCAKRMFVLKERCLFICSKVKKNFDHRDPRPLPNICHLTCTHLLVDSCQRIFLKFSERKIIILYCPVFEC